MYGGPTLPLPTMATPMTSLGLSSTTTIGNGCADPIAFLQQTVAKISSGRNSTATVNLI